MKRQRSVPVVLGIVLALSARIAVASPLQDGAELRAVIHCTAHTGRPVTVPESRRCCEVSYEADAPAKLTAPPFTVDAHVPALLVTLPFNLDLPGLVHVSHTPRPGSRHGPPIYLALQSIRC